MCNVSNKELSFTPPAKMELSQPAEPEVQKGKALRAGDLCTRCGEGRLDYDGLLNLACSRCGYALGGCFT